MQRISLVLIGLMIPLSPVLLAQEAQWEWQHPWPANRVILDIDHLSDESVLMVGHGGTLILSQDNGESWSRPNLDVVDNFYNCTAVPGGHAWVGGERGNLAYTHDAGETWASRVLPISGHIFDIEFLDAAEGWVMARADVWHTTDGGDNWELQYEYDGRKLSDLSVIGDTIWAIGWPDWDLVRILRSTDGGNNWEVISELGDVRSNYFQFTSSTTGWIRTLVDSVSSILKTEDGGEGWDPVYTHEAVTWFHFADDDHGWVGLGDTGLLARTSDGGLTWEVIPAGDAFSIRAIHFANQNDGWIARSLGSSSYPYSWIYKTSDGGMTWTRRESQSAAHLYDVAFLNSSVGWTVGDEVILHTTDGGDEWSIFEVEINTRYEGIEITNTGEVWICGRNGVVLHSSDGQVFETIPVGSDNLMFVDIFFLDAQHGYLLGSTELFLTQDAGASWQTIPIERDTNEYFLKIEFVDPGHGWMLARRAYIGEYGEIFYSDEYLLRTTDGGNTWDWLGHAAGNGVSTSDFDFISPTTGWNVGSYWTSGLIWKTVDGGETWTRQYGDLEWPDEDTSLYSLVMLNQHTGFATGVEGTILHTVDGGENWERQPTGAGNRLYALEVEHGKAWAVGSRSTILHLETVMSIPPPVISPIPVNYSLSAYPNPFNPSTTLLLDLPIGGHTTVDVFDVHGRLVERLLDATIGAGYHRLYFDASDLPSGVYYAHSHGSVRSSTAKLILIR